MFTRLPPEPVSRAPAKLPLSLSHMEALVPSNLYLLAAVSVIHTAFAGRNEVRRRVRGSGGSEQAIFARVLWWP